MTLFGIDMAGEIATGFDGLLNAGTLRKMVPTGALDGHGDPALTPTDYVVQGFQESYSIVTRLAAGIPAGDINLMLVAGLCGAEPAIGDQVLMLGDWWQIRNVSRDPAQVTFNCQSFKVLS